MLRLFMVAEGASADMASVVKSTYLFDCHVCNKPVEFKTAYNVEINTDAIGFRAAKQTVKATVTANDTYVYHTCVSGPKHQGNK